LRQTKVKGPLPDATVLKLAVVPTQTVKLLKDVAETLPLSTVTVNVHLLVFPQASVAVLVTVVVPTGKANPLGGTLATVTLPQLSVPPTTKVTLLVHVPDAAFTVMFSGHEITGGVVSITVMV
jgi:hypothetical protein